MLRYLAAGFALCVALSACGGGSTGSGLPPAPAGGASAGPAAQVRIAITIPPAATTVAARSRRPLYVSTNSQSAAIAVNGGTPVVASLAAGSANCTALAGGGRTCTLTIAAPAGVASFSETLYAGPSATGAVLSQGKTSATIVAGKANVVTLTLGGVIATLVLSPPTATPPTGAAATIGLTVNFNDASGAAIIGSDPFVTPVTLTNSDASGATTLSKTVLNTPADAAALSVAYTGAALTQAVIGASAGSVIANAVTITPHAPAVSTSGFNDYTTFGYDNQRDVFNPNSTAITPASLGSLHLAWQATLGNGDYNTQTQPVLATQVAGHEGMLFVGGGTGNVYAYDALTGQPLWTQNLGQEKFTCENSILFYFGVGGTVAYDPASKSIYVVGNSNTGANNLATNTLYKLDAGSGTILGKTAFGSPDATWSSLDFSHTSVTLGSNGLAYVGTSATCDISSWRGRIAAVNVASMTLANTFYTVWNGTSQPWGGGGVWGWGGVSLDFNGNVLTGVGNTDDGSTTHGSIVAPFASAPKEYSGLGDALIKVSPDLTTLQDSHHPISGSQIFGDSVDLDVNGTPAIFRPNGAGCNPMAALQAKSGALYLYDATAIGTGLRAQYQLAPSTYADGFLGAPAFSPATGLLYANVTSSSGSLYPPGMIGIDPGCGHPAVTWHSSFGPDSYPSGIPRSVPAASAGGVVFVGTLCSPDGNGSCSGSVASTTSVAQSALRKPAICCAPTGPGDGALWAVDASTGVVLNGGKPLIYTSGPLRVPPTIDGNWVFVLDNNGSLYALTIDPNVKAVTAKARSVDPRMLTHWQLRPGR